MVIDRTNVAIDLAPYAVPRTASRRSARRCFSRSIRICAGNLPCGWSVPASPCTSFSLWKVFSRGNPTFGAAGGSFRGEWSPFRCSSCSRSCGPPAHRPVSTASPISTAIGSEAAFPPCAASSGSVTRRCSEPFFRSRFPRLFPIINHYPVSIVEVCMSIQENAKKHSWKPSPPGGPPEPPGLRPVRGKTSSPRIPYQAADRADRPFPALEDPRHRLRNRDLRHDHLQHARLDGPANADLRDRRERADAEQGQGENTGTSPASISSAARRTPSNHSSTKVSTASSTRLPYSISRISANRSDRPAVFSCPKG